MRVCAYMQQTTDPIVSHTVILNCEYLQVEIDGKRQLFLHRRNSTSLKDFYQSLSRIIASFEPDIIKGDMNIDLSAADSKLMHLLGRSGYHLCSMSRSFTTINFTSIDAVFAKTDLSVHVLESYFSDHLPIAYKT